MRKLVIGIAIAVLVILGTFSATGAAAGQPTWTAKKVEKKLRATYVKCPRAIYTALSGRSAAGPLTACSRGLNPKHQQIVDCGVTSACKVGCCQTYAVTEEMYKFAKWTILNHDLGQPISWAKCVRAGSRTFTCGVQLMQPNEYMGTPDGESITTERLCLSVTTAPAFKWKATAAYFGTNHDVPLTWKPADPGVCAQLATRP